MIPKEVIQVALVGSGGFTGVLVSTDLVLKCLIGAATLGFIIYKWYKETKQKSN